MTLSLIGLGLGSIDDITERGLELARKADVVYLERYTSSFRSGLEEVEAKIGKKVLLAFRTDLEGESERLLEQARKKHVALLVVGDVFSATTHIALYLDAKKQGTPVQVVFNASILTGVGVVGLELYKYGRTTSIPFPSKGPASSPYRVIAQNKQMGLHTLCLLDLELDDPAKERYMTVNEAIELLFVQEEAQKRGIILKETIAVGCARVGQEDFLVRAGSLQELAKTEFGAPLHCLIIPGTLHFIEEEALDSWREKTQD